MEDLESNAAAAATTKTETATADNDVNGVSAASEPLMMESNSKPTIATPVVLSGSEEMVSEGKEKLQEEDKVKKVPDKKIDVASGDEEKLPDVEEKAEEDEDTLEDDAQNTNMNANEPNEENISLGDADYAVVVSGDEVEAKEEEEKVENIGKESEGREIEEQGKVDNTRTKANVRKRIKKNTTSVLIKKKKNTMSGDAGGAVASISRGGKRVSGGEKKGEEDATKDKVGNTSKKANKRKRKLKNTTPEGTGNVVSVVFEGEKNVVKEKGVNTPKESNRLKRKKMSADSGDAVAAISGVEERVEDEDEGNVENAPKKKKATQRESRGVERRKNTTLGHAGDPVAKDADKPETSTAGKGSKRVKSMGMIFMCNSKTKQDCYRYKVLGLPASKKEIVSKIYEGMRLFLYDIDLKLLYGIYKAAGPGGYNIEHKAFKSAFPSQVRFTILDDCLPLSEKTFKAAIKDNYYGKNKFNCELTTEQVTSLCKLFIKTKGSKSKRGGGVNSREVPSSVERDRVRRHPRLPGDRFPTSQFNAYEREAYAPQPLPPTLHGRSYEREAYASQPLPPTLHRRSYERGEAYAPQPLPPPLHGRSYEREAYAPQLLPPTLYRRSYEREAYVSPPRPPLLPPPVNVYGQPVQASCYRRDPQIELHDHRLTYSELRQRNETGYRESDILYQETPSYRDPLYQARRPLGYHPPSY